MVSDTRKRIPKFVGMEVGTSQQLPVSEHFRRRTASSCRNPINLSEYRDSIFFLLPSLLFLIIRVQLAADPGHWQLCRQVLFTCPLNLFPARSTFPLRGLLI